MLSSDDALGRSGDNYVLLSPASSASPSEAVLPGTRWLCSISIVPVSLSIAQTLNLMLSAGLELAYAEFHCLSALVCHAAGRAVKISLVLRFGSKKKHLQGVFRVSVGPRESQKPQRSHFH